MRFQRLLLAFLFAFATRPATAEEARLVLLHTTDLHGALTAYDYSNDRPANRGLVKIATRVDAARHEGIPTLLLDAGDCIQGSPLETLYQRDSRGHPDPMVTAMNRIGYDAMAVGNHEFSFGISALERARSQAHFPWLAANILREATGQAAFQASLVKTAGPLKIGVVGICTPAVPFMEDSINIAGLKFLAPVEAARHEVERLRNQDHCNVVVILAHTGLERDPITKSERPSETPDENWGYRLATEVPGVDVVILGHTHVVIPSTQIGDVLVSQAGKWGEGLGRIDLTLSRAGATDPWKITTRRAQVLAVSDSTASDSTLTAFSEPYHVAVQAALSRVIGTASKELTSPGGRFENGPVWELIHHAERDASGADVSLASLFDPAVRIARGPVTARDALRIYPYDNSLVMVELTGQELKETLERAASVLAPYTYEADRPLVQPGAPVSRLESAQGVRYEIDLTRPAGDRIQNLQFQGQPLAADRKLKVAINGYRAAGGGGFEALRRAPRLWRSAQGVRDLLVQWIEHHPELDGNFESHWRLLPDYAFTRERPLIDLLVRQGIAPKTEVLRLGPDAKAVRGDLAYWLARAFAWRDSRRSRAFPDLPDSLEPWVDGLLKQRVMGEGAGWERFEPRLPIRASTAVDWCERAGRRLNYALRPGRDLSFRHAILTGVASRDGSGEPSGLDTLTRAELLGIVANTRFPRIRVLETTDFHGAILPAAPDRRNPRRATGGSAVLAAYISRLRSENPEGTILVDGGDWFQGTMISNLQFGRPVVEQMNALRYTAAVIGNHEFDWTIDTLSRRIDDLHCIALGANVRDRKTGRRPRWAHADTVVSRRGVRIGVLGLCYRNTPTVTLPKNVRALRFEDDSLTAAQLVPRLRKQADVVIGIGHLPAESDSTRRIKGGDLLRLARGVKGVDAWFGGHSHNLVVDRVDSIPTLISGSHGQVVGVCDLVFDPIKHRVIETRTELVQTYADQVVPDSAMQARVERWNAAVAPIASQPLGKNASRLTLNRGGESTVGDLVADAMRRAAGTDVALQNSGGLRADLPEGVVTRGAVYEIMPFDNTIFTMELTGAEIRRALEQSLRFGRVTQVSGIRYGFDSSRPEYQRIVTLTDSAETALDDAKLYRVACNDFMATGGDNYDVLSGGRDRQQTGALVRDAIEALVVERSRHNGALDVRPDGRIRRVGVVDRGGDAAR